MKKSLRNSILQKRNSLSKEEILSKSKKIEKNLFQLEEFKKATVVMFFVSFGNEVYTHDMLKDALKQKIVVVPKVIQKEIEPSVIIDFEQLMPSGKFGILEPIDVTKISLKNIQAVLVPGTVFDRKGHRIGYGFGYYDKFLAKVPHAIKIGLAFGFQIVGKIPEEGHDVAVDAVVTDEGIIKIRSVKFK